MLRHAWVLLVLGLAVAMASPGVAQDPDPPGAVELKQNWPNPFKPSTTIPFRLSAELFEGGHRPTVSLRVYNILTQLVAVPTFVGTGDPVDGVQLTWNGTGEYEAYWDGRVQNTDREAPSGIYVYQLLVDGKRFTKRMIIMN